MRLRRRSKYILADLGSDETLLIHLGMSGRMLISGDPLGQFLHDHPAPEKHDHVVLHMDERRAHHVQRSASLWSDGSDSRPPSPIQHPLLSPSLAPNRWATPFNESYLIAALRGKNTPDQIRASGSANRRRAGQYLCLRGALSRAAFRPHPQGRADIGAARVLQRPCSHHPRRAERSDRRGRLVPARLSPSRAASWVIFNTISTSMTAKANPARTPGCNGTIRRTVQSGTVQSFYCPRCQR